jgi:hypothetical protein
MPEPTRVEQGRRRARAAKRAVALAAAAGFAVVLGLVRQGHPAAGAVATHTGHRSTGSSSSSPVERQGGSALGGGSGTGTLAPSSGASPPVASRTS